MKQCFVVVLAIVVVGCTPSSTAVDKELAKVLTQDRWVKDLGTGALTDQWVYDFAADGTYTQQIRSDFTSSPATGKWKLTLANDSLCKLTLFDLEPGHDYYWLGEESLVRYDRQKDLLIVTGTGYAGEQSLRREAD